MSGPERPPRFELLSTRKLHEYPMFAVREDRVRIPRSGKDRDYQVVESPDGVTVLAFTGAGELVLVEQFREPLRELSLELPSGVVDEGEDPADAGVRELREETGYVGEAAEPLGTLVLNPSWQTTRVHVLLVRGAEPRGRKELDDGEDTRVRCLAMEEVRRLVLEGELRSAMLLAALGLLSLKNGAADAPSRSDAPEWTRTGGTR